MPDEPIEPAQPAEVFRFIVSDFESAWDCIARKKQAVGRGNLLFTRHAMTLLEWASMLASADPSGAALRDFSESLWRLNPRYFTPLPAKCGKPSRSRWSLPYHGDTQPERQLLWWLFDLVRHGLAHQYLQINAPLANAGLFGVMLTGAEQEVLLTRSRQFYPESHLKIVYQGGDSVGLILRPDLLFLDLRDAITDSHLIERGLKFPFFKRERSELYGCRADELAAAFEGAGHVITPVPIA